MHNLYDENSVFGVWQIWDGEKFVPSVTVIGEEAEKARDALVSAARWGADFHSVFETLSWSFDGSPHYLSGAVSTPAYTHTIRIRGSSSYYAMLDGERLVGLVLCINNINNDRVLLFRPDVNPGLAEIWAATRYMEFGVRRYMDGPTTLERVDLLQENRAHYARAIPFYEKEIEDAQQSLERNKDGDDSFLAGLRKHMEWNRDNASRLLESARQRVAEIDAELSTLNA